jgi:energy-coupling factor transport system ATP-binding protein
MALFEIDELKFAYPEEPKFALDGITLSVESGEFLAVCGKSGCGKSTLLRQLKTALTPHGERSGQILFDGRAIEDVTLREQTARIGYVLQSPDNQIVTDKVWHELAFGLESLGEDSTEIRLRVAEMASFFGIQSWYHKTVFELSGGQKQLLNLASVMTLQPDVLILDEPTSQLDPIAASDFLATIRKINTEIGTTIILSEHRLEEVLPSASNAVVLAEGKIIAEGSPAHIGHELKRLDDPMLFAMPTPMRVFLALEDNVEADVPVTVGAGRKYLESRTGLRVEPAMTSRAGLPRSARNDGQGQGLDSGTSPRMTDDANHSIASVIPAKAGISDGPPVVSVKNAWFRYEKDGDDILRGLDLTVSEGEFLAIVGGNGTGKTTSLGVISGLFTPYRGKVTVLGADMKKTGAAAISEKGLGVLPQDPQTLFTRNTIYEDLLEIFPVGARKSEATKDAVAKIAALTEIEDLLEKHPYDVSGGEQQRAALAKVLLLEPKLILLDEPTKGMDSFFKIKFAGVLAKMQAEGLTIVMVSHDLEFCAAYADRCALFFDGSIVTENIPREFFSGNSFYTTAANRMSRHIFDGAITVDDVVARCRNIT